ncbi:MAG: tetratricopeptide repeat protein [Deltaproteobacteria bacterium]
MIRLLHEVSVSEVQHLRSLVRQAALYGAQGLLAESRGKYEEILSFLGNNQQFQNGERLAEAIRTRIEDVNRDLAEIRSAPSTPDLSPQLQNLIKKLFTFSKTKEMAAMEGATALAKFGQYEEAVSELQRLLKEGVLPTVAAKNILRCYLALSLPQAAVAQFKEWLRNETLSREDLKYVRDFLEGSLRKKGLKEIIPALSGGAVDTSIKTQDDFLDISSVKIFFNDGKRHRYAVELDVTYQIGNLISIVVSAADRALLDSLKIGKSLSDIQIYTPVTVFRSSGIVSRKSVIEKGPRKGNYLVDITLSENG